MPDIRIVGLPLATGPTAPAPSDVIPIDGSTTRKAPLSAIADAIRPMASQAEAEAGTNAVKGMSPLTTAQAISAQAATAAQGGLADTALQPGEAATPSQGMKADSALQAPNLGLGGVLVWGASKAQLQSALNASAGQRLIIPAGEYVMSGLSGTATEFIAQGDVVIKRPDSDSSNDPIIRFDNVDEFYLSDKITFDGNKSNQTVAANCVEIISCSGYTISGITVANAKESSGYGAGIVVLAGRNKITKRRSLIEKVNVQDCENDGIYVNGEYYLDIDDVFVKSCGSDGILFANLVYPPVSDVFQGINLTRFELFDNGNNGFNFLGFYTGSTPPGNLGNGVPPARFVTIRDGLCQGNTHYGGLYQGIAGLISGVKFFLNGTTGGLGGGLCANAESSLIEANYFQNNANFQVDIGGAKTVDVISNKFRDGGLALNVPTVDINVGGTQGCTIAYNTCEQSGTHTMYGIKCIGTEATEPSNPIDFPGIDITIEGNRIISNGAASSVGIDISEGYDWAVVRNNRVMNAAAGREYFLQVERLIESGNTYSGQYGSFSSVPLLASNATLIIPDVGDAFYLTGTNTISTIRTVSANTYLGKVRNVTITNKGSGYSRLNPPTVSFSGGGGSGAAGTVQISNAGQIVDVILTNLGSGYTSAPSVLISGGAGSGATGISEIGCNNFDGKEITLMPQSPLSLGTGGNLGIAAPIALSANQPIRLRGAYGNWYRIT